MSQRQRDSNHSSLRLRHVVQSGEPNRAASGRLAETSVPVGKNWDLTAVTTAMTMVRVMSQAVLPGRVCVHDKDLKQ